MPETSSIVVHGKRCRCPHCELSVNIVATPAPAVCPYCRHALVVTETAREQAEVFIPPSKEETQARLRRLYAHPPRSLVVAIAVIGVLMLGLAVILQLRSVEAFWYQPLVSFYSLFAGIFVISRFIFAALYQAPRDAGYEPTVTVLVPCMNEGKDIRRTLELIFDAGYPDAKLEVVCVNDGSTDNTLSEMFKAQTRHPNLVIVDFEHNHGLCHAWGVATLIARGEFMVCVDSDTFIFPGSLRKLMQGFIDPSVGGISGHCDVENAGTNLLTQMQDVRYFFSYKIMKAAESIFGTVSCLPGCFSAYRRVCVLAVLSDWLNATVMGEHGNFADDRSLTNCILKDYKIIYDDEALACTAAPEHWHQYARQQARWNRSYVREIWKAGRFMWHKHPVPAISWYAMMWMPLAEPFVMISAMIVAPTLMIAKIVAEAGTTADIVNGVGLIFVAYLTGVMAITIIWCLHFLAMTGRKWWWAGTLFTLTYMGFFSWQIYWALFTLRGRKWGTRG